MFPVPALDITWVQENFWPSMIANEPPNEPPILIGTMSVQHDVPRLARMRAKLKFVWILDLGSETGMTCSPKPSRISRPPISKPIRPAFDLSFHHLIIHPVL